MDTSKDRLGLTLTNAFVTQRQSVRIAVDAPYTDLENAIADVLGFQVKNGMLVVGEIFRSEMPSVLFYRPRHGVLLPDKNLFDNNIHDQDEIYYWMPLPLLLDDIFLTDGSSLGQKAVLLTLEYDGAYYPVVVPKRLSKVADLLANIVFHQINSIAGNNIDLPEPLPPQTILVNTRTGLQINLSDPPPDLSALIRTGDTLQLKSGNNELTESTSQTLLEAIEIEDPTITLETIENEIELEDPVASQITLGEEQDRPIMPEQIRRKAVIVGKTILEIVSDDITLQNTDAIVNAANPHLAGGGGVDGAIHRAAGHELARASMALAPCPPGEAVLTPGFRLPARWVIHTVGPRYQGGNEGEAEILVRAYTSSLVLARASGFQSISFPSISTGIYGYPIDEAAYLALQTCYDWLAQYKAPQLIRFVLFTDHGFEVYAKALDNIKSNVEGNASPASDVGPTEASS